MSDAHEGGTGGWEPIPQSEGYDGDATAFVQLPPEFMLEGVPLEAPGHGYVPPMITPLVPLSPPPADPGVPEPGQPDPAAAGAWTAQPPYPQETGHQGAGHQGAGHQGAGQDAVHGSGHEVAHEVAYDAGYGVGAETAHQVPHEALHEAAHEQTASWTIPTFQDGPDVQEDSGEYTASSMAQYASSAPATLPGGAPAPWAVTEPEPEPVPVPEAAQEPVPGAEPVEEAPAAEAPDETPAVGLPPVDPQGDPAADGTADVAADMAATPPAGQPADRPVDPPAGPPADLPVAPPSELPVDMSTDSEEHPHISYTLRVNGADRPVTDSWIGESLLYVLRERLGLAGAKDGCSQGECGACNVQVDGRLVASCLVPAATAAGCEVRTVEGLAVDGEPSDVQRALAKCGVQCGFCIPGMAMTVHDLLEGNHAPTELETRQALCGNLCRCSGYRGVLDAVKEVVAGREAAAGPGDEARIPHQIPHPHDGGTA
ncbi:2Fe-2S iron-sulfur cluster-binding protein [Streptomyces sp. NPDC006339]|uniref:2Fe-2S iron-sulfur cluster-binding protein n=1 Tax=Streptomyces sp. NPDC006339 TaxID=3156755 RepID=UPI0033B0C070